MIKISKNAIACVIFISIIVMSNNLDAQAKNDYLYQITDSLKSVTRSLMNKLNIPIRQNTDKDDPLVIATYSSKYSTARYSQKAITPYRYSQKTVDTLNRWYIEPSILISDPIDSILKKKKSKLDYTNSLSSIIHELVHFFQLTYLSDEDYIEGSLENWQQHLKQPIELEAYSVEAYFYLSQFHKKELKKIMKEKISDFERRKKLYNTAHQLKWPSFTNLLLK